MSFPIRKASAKTTVKPAKSAGSGKSTASQAEDALALHLRAEGIEAIREYRFAAEACGGPGKGLRDRLAKAGLQDWRADFALIEHGLLIECEGGGWVHGRHNTGAGFAADLKKYDGVTVESFNTLTAKDAYSAWGGYRAQQNMKCIIHHAEFGEVGRHAVNPNMLKGEVAA